MLQSMGLQRVGRDLVTEQQQQRRLRSGITGLYNNSMFNFWETIIPFSIAIVPFYIPTSNA